jgi:predicted MFS family arabinose efflux permease
MSKHPTPQHYLIPAFVGFCVMALALGLGRFAYTPLLPEMARHHWFNETVASYIGATNFLGYVLGAIIAKRLTHYKPAIYWVKCSLLFCALSLAACIIHWDIAWLLVWRMIAGLSGALLMVLTPPVIYRATHKQHITLVSGIMFGGIGLGIIYGALITPALASYNISFTWTAIAVLGFLLASLSWFFLPNPPITLVPSTQLAKTKTQWHLPIALAFVAYCLFGYGAVPHLLYMVDYTETMLKSSIYLANLGWLIYGIGNTIGSPIFGYLSKHIGMKRCLIATYLIATLSISILFISHNPWIGLASFALNGIIANSIVSLTSSYLTTLAPHSQQTHLWGVFTVFAASAQTAAGALMAHWVSTQAGFNWMFLTASLAMLLAAVAILSAKKPLPH